VRIAHHAARNESHESARFASDHYVVAQAAALNLWLSGGMTIRKHRRTGKGSHIPENLYAFLEFSVVHYFCVREYLKLKIPTTIEE
jgi:hypothetical protein